MQRIKQYSAVSTSFACLSNQKLEQMLADAKPIHQGIGGQSALISIDDTPVFVKKIPLTDLEQRDQHFMSTANIFDLPLCYQYGVGSAGFGVWRELSSHIMTTNGVISGECANFPLMYHWRILPTSLGDTSIHEGGDIEKYCHYWENSASIRKRIEDLNKAQAYIALFLEYVPHNVSEWLGAQIAKGDDSAERAVTFVDQQLKETIKYMNALGLVHFDVHFENILTDGKQLYISDFGLALSSRFDLSAEEVAFLKQHQSYDHACAAVNLLHCIVASFFDREPGEIRLRQYLASERSHVRPAMNAIINRHAPIALLMDEFFQKLRKESKSTPYPAAQIEKWLILSD